MATATDSQEEIYSLETLQQLLTLSVQLGFMDDAKDWRNRISKLKAKN